MPAQDRRHLPSGRSPAIGRSRSEYHLRYRLPTLRPDFTVLRRENYPITCVIDKIGGVRWLFVEGYTAERFLRAWLEHPSAYVEQPLEPRPGVW